MFAQNLTNTRKYLPYFMCGFPVLFFAYQFILRLWPGLMMQQIMAQFSIDASHFGVLAALYYYGYAGMQIPVAILLDRFSARYVICVFAVLCGVATLTFAFTNNWYVACVSRFLVGVGSAVGFLGTSKVISEWFSRDRYAKMIGFSFTVGLLGAIYGGKPVNFLIENYSWQNVTIVLALAAIVIGVSTCLVLRTKNKQQPAVTDRKFKVADFKVFLASPFVWTLAVANLLMVGALEGFADVWGVQYLVTAHGIVKGDAAQLVSFIFFGMLFGGPLLALCSKKLGNYATISLCGVGMALLLLVMLYGSQFNWWLFASLFFCIGVMCCYQVIVFAAGADLVLPQYLGVMVAFLNCINMLGGSFFHTCIGRLMDLFWSGVVSADGLKQYDLVAYKYAMGIIPACAVAGALLVALVGMQLRSRQHDEFELTSANTLYLSRLGM